MQVVSTRESTRTHACHHAASVYMDKVPVTHASAMPAKHLCFLCPPLHFNCSVARPDCSDVCFDHPPIVRWRVGLGKRCVSSLYMRSGVVRYLQIFCAGCWCPPTYQARCHSGAQPAAAGASAAARYRCAVRPRQLRRSLFAPKRAGPAVNS